MDVLTLLQGRSSVPADELDPPAPAGEVLDSILRAGLSAPDHGTLRPWRFILIRGEARRQLGDVFVRATRARRADATADELQRQRGKPMRAPLIVAVAARIDPDHPTIPAVEQLLSAGAATQQMALAANAHGFGAVWLTGPNAYDALVAEALGLEPEDRLVAFLYLGTPRNGFPARQRPDPAAFVSEWHEPLALETL